MAGIEVSGLDALVADLEANGPKLATNLRKAVQVTSAKIKADARSRISGYRHLPAYPYSITYDTTVTADGVEGEIGPDKALPQGPLGNILEYGTSTHAPLPHLGPALDAGADDLAAGVDIAVTQALR